MNQRTQERVRPLVMGVLVTGSILLAGCGGGSRDQSSAPTATAVGIDYQQLLSSPDVDQSQRDILADGVVDRAELEQALSYQAQCLDGLGYDASWEFVSDSQFVYTVLNRPGNNGDSGAAEQECATKYSDVVQIAWSVQNQPTPAEQAAFEQAVLACLADKGISVADYAAAQNMIDIDSFIACQQAARESR